MASQSDYSITNAYPASHPDKIQLYSFPTPNGVKASIMLEEIGFDYEPHLIDITKDETWTDEFLALNPNGKIPALIDPNGPGGVALGLFESGAILNYLAEKSGKLLSDNPAKRHETLAWVFFQVGHIGPMFGQLGYFYAHGGKEIEDKRPLERYAGETKRLLGVLEGRLKDRDFIMDTYSIADIASLGWVRGLVEFYDAGDLVGWDRYTAVQAWLERCLERPAVQKGLTIPAVPQS